MYLFKRSNKVYYIRYINNLGKIAILSTGKKSKAEAGVFLNEFRQKLKDSRSSIQLKQLIFQYLKHSEITHTAKTQKVLKGTYKFLQGFINPETPINQITTNELRQYLETRLRDSSVYQARIDRINLSSLFSYALDCELIEFNPITKIKPFKLPEKQPLFFSESEFRELLKATPTERMRFLIEFAFNTGMRQSEILSLRWNQIDFKNQFVNLDNRTAVTKSKKVRTIPLNLRCLQMLTELNINKSGDFVFTDAAGKQYKADHVIHQFKKYVLRAGLNPGLHFHSLRHSFASLLVQKGVSLFFVSKLLGHSNTKTTEIYSHIRQSDLKDVVNLLNQAEDI